MYEYVIIAIALSAAYFFSESFFEHLKKIEVSLTSFSAGLFITAIFLTMLPVLMNESKTSGMNSFFVALWGFVILHIFEKYVLQYSKKKEDFLKNTLRLRMFSQILNHLMLGYAITFFFVSKASLWGYIISLPMAFYLFSSAVISEESHKKFHSTITGKLVASAAIFAGAIIAIILSPFSTVLTYTFSFAMGVFIYIIVRDVMPTEKRGNVFYFLYGIITYFLVLGLMELIAALT